MHLILTFDSGFMHVDIFGEGDSVHRTQHLVKHARGRAHFLPLQPEHLYYSAPYN